MCACAAQKYSSTIATIFTAIMSFVMFGHALTVNFGIGVSIVFISMHQVRPPSLARALTRAGPCARARLGANARRQRIAAKGRVCLPLRCLDGLPQFFTFGDKPHKGDTRAQGGRMNVSPSLEHISVLHVNGAAAGGAHGVGVAVGGVGGVYTGGSGSLKAEGAPAPLMGRFSGRDSYAGSAAGGGGPSNGGMVGINIGPSGGLAGGAGGGGPSFAGWTGWAGGVDLTGGRPGVIVSPEKRTSGLPR